MKKTVVLGVTGSIAAYKAVEVLRLLVAQGVETRCVLTPGATHFVTALMFQALSGHPVLCDMFDLSSTSRFRNPSPLEGEGKLIMCRDAIWPHLDLAETAACIAIVPASADCLARLAAGRASDLLSALVLATRAPVLIAPAMHDSMWAHKATQANLKTLRSYGYRFIGPERGPLGRVGDAGLGRLSDPPRIVAEIQKVLKR